MQSGQEKQRIAPLVVQDPGQPVDDSIPATVPSKRLIAVKVNVSNTGTSPFVVNPEFNWTVVDTHGNKYAGGVGWPALKLGAYFTSDEVPTGTSTTAVMKFNVPKSATLTKLVYQPRTGGPAYTWPMHH